jgi:hypothetical protein
LHGSHWCNQTPQHFHCGTSLAAAGATAAATTAAAAATSCGSTELQFCPRRAAGPAPCTRTAAAAGTAVMGPSLLMACGLRPASARVAELRMMQGSR